MNHLLVGKSGITEGIQFHHSMKLFKVGHVVVAHTAADPIFNDTDQGMGLELGHQIQFAFGQFEAGIGVADVDVDLPQFKIEVKQAFVQGILPYILKARQIELPVGVKAFAYIDKAVQQFGGVVKGIHIMQHIGIKDPIDQLVLILEMIIEGVAADIAVVCDAFYRNFG